MYIDKAIITHFITNKNRSLTLCVQALGKSCRAIKASVRAEAKCQIRNERDRKKHRRKKYVYPSTPRFLFSVSVSKIPFGNCSIND